MEGRHVFLTGPPGVGKTTLIKNAIAAIKGKVPLNGFYTEEMRTGGQRVGFDVVGVDGERCALSRVEEQCTYRKRPKVGKYAVHVDEFESFVSPIFGSCQKGSVFILDEVGKMELLSRNFSAQVSSLLKRNDVTVLGTIPVRKGNGISFVEHIRTSEDVRVFDITHQNRDTVLSDIVSVLPK